MKKYSARSFLLLLLVITSLSSYIFLNTVPGSNPPNPVNETEESAEQQFFLPDIELVKKLVDLSKPILIRPSNN